MRMITMFRFPPKSFFPVFVVIIMQLKLSLICTIVCIESVVVNINDWFHLSC